jgi:hypothetical protein
MAKSTYRTLRGSIKGSGNLKRELLLDDGLINQGYRITDFVVWAGGSTGSLSCFATLSSKAKTAGTFQDAGINTEIAWAQYSYIAAAPYNFRYVDLDHIINRDLLITLVTGANATTWNYLITMEARNLSDDEAILAIIREEAQNVGA